MKSKWIFTGKTVREKGAFVRVFKGKAGSNLTVAFSEISNELVVYNNDFTAMLESQDFANSQNMAYKHHRFSVRNSPLHIIRPNMIRETLDLVLHQHQLDVIEIFVSWRDLSRAS